MTTVMKRLGARIDSWGGARRMRRFREGWPATATDGVAFHRTPKVQYRYLVAGSGPTIVFTADPPMVIEHYGPLLETFGGSYRVVVVELPAMGFSATASSYGFGFRETSEDLAQFLREIAGPGAILAFSCAATLLALDIAAWRPDLASHLVMIQGGDAATFAAWKAARDPKGVLGRPIIGQLLMARLGPKRMPDWYGLATGRTASIPSFCACAATSLQHGALWSLASAYQIFLEEVGALPPPPQPMLSLWGASDGSHPASHAHGLARLRPDLVKVTYDDLGHFPELEDPDRAFAAIDGFVAETKARACDHI